LPLRLRHSLRPRAVLRLLLLGFALPCVYFGGVCAAFFYHQHAAHASHDFAHFALTIPPTRATRLMVFAPHCDDETLGCAGLMQRTLAAGGAVRAVMLTNGDGFRTAVEREARSLRVGPRDYIQFAALRQQESVRALTHLGLRREDVSFFGYPDQGLMSLWNSCWEPDSLYTSRYTRCDRSPYANTFDSKSSYCGKDVLDDIKTALRAFRPTLIAVTHPADDHPDHAAASAFVAQALQELRADPQDAAWANHTRLIYYLIHRGDWPAPQGAHPSYPLVPPTEMAYLDTRWTTLPLTPAETARKAESIDLYPSQTALMRRFLTSFVRRSELFGEIAPSHLPLVPEHSMQVDADAKDWESLPPAVLDPVRDNVLRDLQGSGDIRALYACRDAHFLYLRLDTRQPVSRRLTYTVRLRAFGPDGETAPTVTTLRLRAGSAGNSESDGLRVAAKGRLIEAALPAHLLTDGLDGAHTQTVAVSAETSLAGVPIDSTGIRFLRL
jgi:LmbE family N-acetylglucosaminyl deacetylase